MIELSRTPARRRMANCTIMVVVALDVTRIGNILESCLMAGPTIRRRAVKPPIHMTLRTLSLLMRTGQWESSATMVKLSRTPARRGVANRTIMVVVALNVTRVSDIGEGLLVAGPTVSRSPRKPPAHMASRTIHHPVSPRQRIV